MSDKQAAAYHGSTLREEILRAAPFSDDEGLLRRAAARIEELEADLIVKSRAMRVMSNEPCLPPVAPSPYRNP